MELSILIYIAAGIASLAVLAKASDNLLDALSDYAHKIGASDYLAGFFILAIGTALPELAASLSGARLGESAVVLGTILGSNFFKIPLLGVGFVLGKKMKVNLESLGNAPVTTFLACALPIILVIDGELTRVDGVIMLFVYAYYVALLWSGEGELGKLKKDVPIKKLWKDMFTFWICLVFVLLASIVLVVSARQVAEEVHMSLFLVSFVIIGIGSSAPEISVLIQTVRKKKQAFTFGNILGSMVANSLFALGIVTVISPFSIDPMTILPTGIAYLVSLLVTFWIIEREYVDWRHGLVLIGMFVLFVGVETYLG